MKMKKLITLLLALAMVLSLAACGSKDNSNANNDSQGNGVTPTAATYKIKLGTTGNEEHQSTIAANFFKEKVEELTNGAVTVEIYPNSQLGSEREMAEGVKLGTLEMTIVTTDGTLPAWVPETQVLSIPYLLTSKEVAYEVLDNTLQPYFAPLFEAQGFKHLAFCELGFRHFTTNKREITCAADMKGQSIRVQEAPIWFALTDCLGATATPVAFNELYTALSQGMVDGQENPIPSIASSKFYEVQKYMCLDGHTYGAESILINLDYYNNLPAEIQTAIDEAAAYAGEQQRAAVSANEAAQLQQIKDAGVIVCEDPDITSFQEATAELYLRPEGQAIVSPELTEMVRSAAEAADGDNAQSKADRNADKEGNKQAENNGHLLSPFLPKSSLASSMSCSSI